MRHEKDDRSKKTLEERNEMMLMRKYNIMNAEERNEYLLLVYIEPVYIAVFSESVCC